MSLLQTNNITFRYTSAAASAYVTGRAIWYGNTKNYDSTNSPTEDAPAAADTHIHFLY